MTLHFSLLLVLAGVLSYPAGQCFGAQEAQMAGIIGMELLALNRGIVDFDGMNLFLK
jgi:hypothetical protein